jgi:hypothetical protein
MSGDAGSADALVKAVSASVASGLRAAIQAELQGSAVADDSHDQTHSSDSSGTSSHSQTPRDQALSLDESVGQALRPIIGELRAQTARPVAEDADHDQTHSSGGSGGDIQQRLGAALLPAVQQELRALEAADESAHDQTHSSGGGHDQSHSSGSSTEDELERASAASRSAARPVAEDAADHDQTHSSGIQEAAQRAAIEDADHDQTHSSGGGGGSIQERVSEALAPIIQQELRSRAGGSVADADHDQTHSSGIQEAAQRAAIADADHDQTHSSGGGGSIQERVSEVLLPIVQRELRAQAAGGSLAADDMFDQSHSESHKAGSESLEARIASAIAPLISEAIASGGA